MKVRCFPSVALLSCALMVSAALAPSVVNAQGFTVQDTQLRFDGANVSPLSGTARSGFTNAPAPGGGIEAIFVYRLPVIAAGTTISDAVLSLNLASITTAGASNFNIDLYALPFRATPTISVADFYVGPSDPSTSVSLIQNDFLLRSNPVSTTPLGRYLTNTEGSANLASFLNAQYAAGAVGGAAGDFVFFRLSPDVPNGLVGGVGGGYNWSTQDNASTSGLRPLLTLTTASITTAPEPGTLALLGIATLPLVGSRLRRRKTTAA